MGVTSKNSLLSLSLFIVIFSVFYSYKRYNDRLYIANTPLNIERISMSDYLYNFSESLGSSCDHPLLIRNGVSYFENNICKNNESDYCSYYIKNRMVSFWRNNFVEAFPASHLSDNQNTVYYESSKMSLYNYFNDPKYKDYLIHTLHQLGHGNEYSQFLSFDHDKLDEDKLNNIFYNVLNISYWQYVGSEFFMSQKLGSGSVLHFAFGLNLFVMLAGRKRWLLVNPAYLNDAGCVVGLTGIYGDCAPIGNDGIYLPRHASVDVDKYREILLNEIGIPENAIVDVILNPGDILINCPIWAHTIENLDENTIAYSFRAALKKPGLKSIFFIEKALEAIYQSLKTKFYYFDFEKFTLIDNMLRKTDKSGGLDLDNDNRFSGKSFINSQDETDKPKVEG